MKNNFIIKSLALAVSVNMVIPLKVNAGIPTIDIANVIQTTITSIESIQQVVQLYEQIDNQIQQIQTAYDQIDNQVKQFENINGDYFKDMLLNNAAYKSKRRLVPKTYEDVLDLYKNIGVAGHEIATNAGWAARDAFEIEDVNAYFDDVNTDEAKQWQQQEINSMAAVGVAESAFERVDSLLEETEDLMDDIKNSPDDKAAQDLQNRMSGQTQLLLAELIRLQGSQATSQGRKQLYDHAIKGEDKQRARVDVEFESIL